MGTDPAAGKAASKAGRKWAMRALLSAGAILLATPGASAACVVPYICYGDTNRDGTTDTVSVSSAAGGVAATSFGTSRDTVTVRAPASTTMTVDFWTKDANGDRDPEELYAGTTLTTSATGSPNGGYATAYVVDYDQGDVIDYAYAVVAAGAAGHHAALGAMYYDAKADFAAGTVTPGGYAN